MVVLTTIVGGLTQIPHGNQDPHSMHLLKGVNAHSNQRIVTVEDNLNKKLDGLKNDFEHKWGNLQDSIENLIYNNVHQRKSSKVTPWQRSSVNNSHTKSL